MIRMPLVVVVAVCGIFFFILSVITRPVHAQLAPSISSWTPGAYTHLLPQSGTQTLKSLPGALRFVTVNTASQGCTLTLYDSIGSAGNPIGFVDCSIPRTLEYELTFQNGLTVSLTSINADITITWQ